YTSLPLTASLRLRLPRGSKTCELGLVAGFLFYEAGEGFNSQYREQELSRRFRQAYRLGEPPETPIDRTLFALLHLRQELRKLLHFCKVNTVDIDEGCLLGAHSILGLPIKRHSASQGKES